MEYLFQINPVLQGNKNRIVIYGVGQQQKRLFHALLQQNIRIDAFCLRENQQIRMEKIFGKIVITPQDMREEYGDAFVIVAMSSAQEDIEYLRKLGMEKILMENITSDDKGIWIEGDMD